MKPTISILGLGWLGAPLAQALVKQGYSVFGSRRSVAANSEGITPFLVDISNLEQEYQDFLATETLIIAIPSRDVEGYRRLAEQIEHSRIKQVLLISSTSVYPMTNGIVTEASETLDSVRTEIEHLFVSSPQFTTTVLRFAGLYGYNRQPGNFFKSGKLINYPEGYVNMIHRDDCIGIIQAILDQKLWGEVLNACIDDHPTRRDFYSWAAAQVGRTDLNFNEEGETLYKIVSNQKLQDLLGYEFKHSKLMVE
ncbi:MAG: NAD(P)-binding domain-containing protein [Bacteroidota bacterium]